MKLLLSLLLLSGLTLAEESKPVDGSFLELSKDGLPWAHPLSSLKFPQQLGDFILKKCFKSKNAAGGYALSYVEERRGLRLDWQLYPPKARIKHLSEVLGTVKKQLTEVVDDLIQVGERKGYQVANRGPVDQGEIPVWKVGELPLFSQSFVLKSKPGPLANPPPSVFNTINLSMFEDIYVQSSLVMPFSLGNEAVKIRDEVDKLFSQVLREPALKEEYLKLCRNYVEKPFEEEGRKAADALLVLCDSSVAVKPVYPGEALTPCLREAEQTAPGVHQDMLRAFSVGSVVVQLQGGGFEDQMQEAARMMVDVYTAQQKEKPALKSEATERLRAAVKQANAAVYLREQMLAPLTP
jgi:hypothetical protein